MSGEKEMEMLTEIFRKFDKYKNIIKNKRQKFYIFFKKKI